MANTIQGSGTFVVRLSSTNSSYTGDMTLNITATGSNAVSEVKNIPTASATALTTSSLDSIRYAYFANESTGSIQIASDSAFTKILTTLQPSDDSKIAMSGSIAANPFFARCTDESAGALLYYILVEN